jgi:RNA polymerase sigma-70 factor (ECF subfamily)
MKGEITQLLADLRCGDHQAESRLASLVYDELHRIATRYMHGEKPNQSLQASMLVHDAFLQMVGQEERNWQNRSHFFAVAAQLMRRILIDYARSRNAQKRGGYHARVELDENLVVSDQNCAKWLVIDQALNRLAERDLRLSRVVELRFFAGMTEQEVAEVLGISVRQVKRDWSVAKGWLHGELSGTKDDNDSGPLATH